MRVLYVTGTAGAGKSLLTGTLATWYGGKGAHAITVNLDPGVGTLPYTPDVDIRSLIDLNTIMNQYQLGPNGALILAADLIASRLPEVHEQITELRPDYAFVDTPGQMELFAYRASGPYIVQHLEAEAKAVVFLFDPALTSTPASFVSIALLAASLQLRLRAPQIAVLSKRDLVGDRWKQLLAWAAHARRLEEEIAAERDHATYLLVSGLLRELVKGGFAFELIPVSATTQEGLVELSATITRIFRGGEEIEE